LSPENILPDYINVNRSSELSEESLPFSPVYSRVWIWAETFKTIVEASWLLSRREANEYSDKK